MTGAQEHILDEIDRFQRATRMTDNRFGLLALNNRTAISNMRRLGTNPHWYTQQRCREFIATEVARFKAQYP